LKLGILEAIKNKSDYLLLFLADMPKIKKNTVDTVMKQIIQSSGKIIRPVFFGKPGFPVALPRYLFDELTLLTGDVGAKAVIDRHKTCLLNVESSDIGCIFDIDEVIRSNDE
ncbi:MAG: nucleotidyltransferase family protein, partial [Thermotogota bacterium]